MFIQHVFMQNIAIAYFVELANDQPKWLCKLNVKWFSDWLRAWAVPCCTLLVWRKNFHFESCLRFRTGCDEINWWASERVTLSKLHKKSEESDKLSEEWVWERENEGKTNDSIRHTHSIIHIEWRKKWRRNATAATAAASSQTRKA